MNNVIPIFSKDMEVDVGIYYATSPPLLVPISNRAKKVLALPKGADSVLFLNDDAEAVLKLFGDDYVIAMLEEYEPSTIVTMTIKLLH